MDRFIVMDIEVLASAFNNLKSNMDRFIGWRALCRAWKACI